MRQMFDKFKQVRALVVGDCMLDRYIEGVTTRISPEAPVPVVAVSTHHSCMGGAANVAAGLAALGCRTDLAGVVGADEDGARLRELVASAGVFASNLIIDIATETICKTRVLADRKQQLLRLDRDGSKQDREYAALGLMDVFLGKLADWDIVVLADYEKGSLPPQLVKAILQEGARFKVPTIVDPKKQDFTSYAQATVLTPNLAELERFAKRTLSTQEEIVAEARRLLTELKVANLLCTCGAEGMLLIDQHRTLTIPAQVRHVSDVAGAGDTVVAVLAACLGARATIDEACQWASAGAGIAVSHPRVYVVNGKDLERAIYPCSQKVIGPEVATELADALRREGRRIVFTNGCFDILHAGHLTYLEEARRLGDALVVGLNSDSSVSRLKGPNRPRIHQEHRAALLAGLACVDWIVLFDENTPESLLRLLKPDVLAKGGDYADSEIVGAEFVRSYGGRVTVTNLVEGLSSTAILNSSGR